MLKTKNCNTRLSGNYTKQIKISQIQHECVETWHSRGQSSSKLCMINDQLINPAKDFKNGSRPKVVTARHKPRCTINYYYFLFTLSIYLIFIYLFIYFHVSFIFWPRWMDFAVQLCKDCNLRAKSNTEIVRPLASFQFLSVPQSFP